MDGRHALSLAGDQVGSPEPSGQWRVTALHDRADSQSCLTSTVAACQRRVEMRNGSPVTPQCGQTKPPPQRTLSRYSAQAASPGEEPLKLPQRPRKRQPRVLIDVHENQPWPRSPLSGNRVQGIAPIASGFRPYSQTNIYPWVCMRQPDKHALTIWCTIIRIAQTTPLNVHDGNNSSAVIPVGDAKSIRVL